MFIHDIDAVKLVGEAHQSHAVQAARAAHLTRLSRQKPEPHLNEELVYRRTLVERITCFLAPAFC